MSHHHRGQPRLVESIVTGACFIGVSAMALVLLVGWFGDAKAASVQSTESWQQPYGGCEEGSLAPHSQGANECRAHGWTIKRRLVVNPHGTVVGSGLPACRNEDGSGQRSVCSWNFHLGTTEGNGFGLSYWVGRHDGIHYVWPRPAHTPWKPVGVQLADALAEGDQPHRRWERCRTTGVHHRVIRVACPDGYTQVAR